MTAAELFGEAISLHHGGYHDAAASGYRRVLSLEPGYVDAYHNLGVLDFGCSRRFAALEWFRRAWICGVGSVEFWVSYGRALGLSDRVGEARDLVEASLAPKGEEIGEVAEGFRAGRYELLDRERHHWRVGRIFNPVEDLPDLYGTEAVIDNLALETIVYTLMAHFAAALGKAAWILDRLNAWWRWLTECEDSPRCGTVQLYRQSAGRDGSREFEQFVLDLRAHAARP